MMQTNQQPRLILRFDIDTVTCMRQGIPRLLEIGKKHNARFTFFANMGRAVSYPALIRKRISGSAKKTNAHLADKLPTRLKLGVGGWLTTVVLNPRVGRNSPLILKEIVDCGHDLGLHGGSNHGTWHHESQAWSIERLRTEVAWGVRAMSEARLPQPTMFASPGFTSPPDLPSVLEEMGFQLLADDHRAGLPAFGDEKQTSGLLKVNTGLVGEPGGVGCLEHWKAARFSKETIIDQLDRCFNRGGDFVLYDHPAYVTRIGADDLDFVINAWRERNGEIATLSDLN
jgi:peptidoglycan/xylan/chitin deacetylase (PgdA/CDA1 family)